MLTVIFSFKQKGLNSFETNCMPLSLTIVSGRPSNENICCNASIVCLEVVCPTFNIVTYGYFEKTSIQINHILPKNGLA